MEDRGILVFEWLVARDDVDASRIGITGISLGDYHAPCVCANEARFAAGAFWGANHNWAEVQQKHMNGQMEKIKVPFLVTHGAGDRQIGLDYAHRRHPGRGARRADIRLDADLGALIGNALQHGEIR